jgi:hypothetical protein
MHFFYFFKENKKICKSELKIPLYSRYPFISNKNAIITNTFILIDNNGISIKKYLFENLKKKRTWLTGNPKKLAQLAKQKLG